MEYYQATQNRAGETVAVINQHVSTLKVGSVGAADLLTQSQALDGLAQARDNALAAFDAAVNAEQQGFVLIRLLTLALPRAAEGDLDAGDETQGDLLHLLDPAFAIVPRTTELALARGKKLVSALTQINAFRAAQVPKLPPITSGGRGVADLATAMAAQPASEQTVEDQAAEVATARTALRNGAVAVDRLNKRFYAKLQGEARTDANLFAALAQITTDSANLPATLGVKSVLQGGTDALHILVGYDNGSFDDALQGTLEWQVAGVDAEFTHSVPADPSGNALGPFTVGQTVRVRTRTRNTKGTTTGSVRTLRILPPVV